jgi:hypothetical protein
MIHYLGYNDIQRLYEATKRDGIDYNLAFIETDFVKTRRDPFDPDYMKALFDYAYAKGRRGYEWHKTPPVLEVSPHSASPALPLSIPSHQ